MTHDPVCRTAIRERVPFISTHFKTMCPVRTKVRISFRSLVRISQDPVCRTYKSAYFVPFISTYFSRHQIEGNDANGDEDATVSKKDRVVRSASLRF